MTTPDPRIWDVRTIERRIRRGHVTRKDYEKHLKALPDVVDKSQVILADDADDDDDDDDDHQHDELKD